MRDDLKTALNEIVKSYLIKYISKDIDEGKRGIVDIESIISNLNSLKNEGLKESDLTDDWLNQDIEEAARINLCSAIEEIKNCLEKSGYSEEDKDFLRSFIKSTEAQIKSKNNTVDSNSKSDSDNGLVSDNKTLLDASKSSNDLSHDLHDLKEDVDNLNLKYEELAKKFNKSNSIAEEAKKAATDAQTTIQNVTNVAADAQRTIQTAKDVATEAKKTSEAIMPNLMTVIGIFISIVIAVVVCYLSVIMTHDNPHNASSELFEILYGLVMGQICFNTVFLLVFLIGKITGKSLALPCKDKNNCGGECCIKEDCSFCKHTYRKFPYMVIINSLFAVADLLLGILLVFDIYLEDSASMQWVGRIGIVILILLLAAFMRFVSKAFRKENS